MRTNIMTGLVLSLCISHALAQNFSDPIDTPSRLVANPQQQSFLASTSDTGKILAVGTRGLLVDFSEDPKQIPLPSSSDLTSIHFANKDNGWITGHDGLILNTRDGGRNWAKQLDGRQALNSFLAFYDAMDDDNTDTWKSEIIMNLGQGATLPFLDIHFTDSQNGFAVGAFGLSAFTRDGGENWHPFSHGLDNPGGLHLNGIIGHDDKLVIASESGALFVGTPDALPLTRIQTPYAGSFFGVVSFDNQIYAYGMRGNLWKSADLHEWQADSTGARGSFSAAATDGQLLVLTTSAGEAFWKSSGQTHFSRLQASARPFSAITLTASEVLLFSLRGITRIPRPDLNTDAGTPP